MKEYFKGVDPKNRKDNYRRLASKLHPDKGGSNAEFQEMKRQFEALESGKPAFSEHKKQAPSGSHYRDTGDYEYWINKYGSKPFSVTKRGYITITPAMVMNGDPFKFKDSRGASWTVDVRETVKIQRIFDPQTNTCVVIERRWEVPHHKELGFKWNENPSLEDLENLMFSVDVFEEGLPIGRLTCETSKFKKFLKVGEKNTIEITIPYRKMTVYAKRDWKIPDINVKLTITLPALPKPLMQKCKEFIGKIFS